MFLAFLSRDQFLNLLPKKAVMAEIGTAKGDFAANIVNLSQPNELNLIDPWEHQATSEYAPDTNNISAPAFEDRFKDVQNKFAAQTATGQVKIHRAYSPQAADLFPDEYFDIVYIDGMHTREAVYADLRAFDRKVKKDGLIMGHDYTVRPKYRAMNFGVVEAVNQFVGETGYEFLSLTAELCPSYLLAKDPQSRSRNIVLNNLLVHAPTLVEIGTPELRGMTEREIVGQDGKPFRTVIGFH